MKSIELNMYQWHVLLVELEHDLSVANRDTRNLLWLYNEISRQLGCTVTTKTSDTAFGKNHPELCIEERNKELEDLLISAHAIAKREGADTAWKRFCERLARAGIGCITAKSFRVLPSDKEENK